jgi:2-keto-4-pentenoate hydratase/2-oxohepta-3-ene-1,7-dioic acid hydratase in catechol pathway
MRIANVNGRLTVVNGEGGIDVETWSHGRFGSDPQAVFAEWEEFRHWVETTSPETGASAPIPDAAIGPPVPRPVQVFGVALNYRQHAVELGYGVPEFPSTFTKFPSCIAPPNGDIKLPSSQVDWEVEVVVVIGRRAHHVAAGDAWSYVAGLTIGQDLSERDVQFRPPLPQFSLAKSYPGFGPIGPVVVTADEFQDPDDLEFTCALNGELVQRSRTSDLIFPIPVLVESISGILPLLPGDLIFTGTPSGVGSGRTPPRYLVPGDFLVSSVEGIGSMSQRAVATQQVIRPA